MENDNSREVIFSTRAYNAIINETFDFEPIETGGILLGHEFDGTWIVLEVIPPGHKSLHQHALFEYDAAFVNYNIDRLSTQYALTLKVLGLWHRHPGSMDVFSTVDDVTNKDFASRNECGAISGLVNVDPDFRLTMYYIAHDEKNRQGRPKYERLPITVNDEFIPSELFQLRYYNDSSDNLHPQYDKKGLVGNQSQHIIQSQKKEAIESEQKIELENKKNDSTLSTIFNIKSMLVVIIILQLLTMMIVPACVSTVDTNNKNEIVNQQGQNNTPKYKTGPKNRFLPQELPTLKK